ncbi:hypothetical protein B0H66DRAFT_530762 [Apodospora peruviana]|uniref:Uncharacterized protein n=1 Tax=Apodospora peruviana TaxID=516989 RepID=A0AAE0IKD8_9PEZI|nr:hypothetical protein B0H66DRAFT_530762 [Apodospora peruviana]
MGNNPEAARLASEEIPLEPRPSRPEEPLAHQQQQPNVQSTDHDLSFLPYPRWATLFTRTCLTLLEFATLVYGIWFLKKWESNAKFIPKKHIYSTAIIAAGVSMGLNSSAVILTLFRRYGEWGFWMVVVMGDLAVGLTALIGALGILWVDHNGFSREELGWFWEEDAAVLGTMAVVVGKHEVTETVCGIGAPIFSPASVDVSAAAWSVQDLIAEQNVESSK